MPTRAGWLVVASAVVAVVTGRVFGIVKAQSLAPQVLDASLGLYQRIMYAPEGLERYQRELLATVVSQENHCHY